MYFNEAEWIIILSVGMSILFAWATLLLYTISIGTQTVQHCVHDAIRYVLWCIKALIEVYTNV